MQTDHAAAYANLLLGSLGEFESITETSDHPAIAWRRSGLLETTGLMLPLSLPAHVDGALMALQSLAPKAKLPSSGALLMGERARLRKTVRSGRFCAGGYGRLLDTIDGRIALNLVRDDDWDLIPAWLEANITDCDGITKTAANMHSQHLTERAAELGLAVAIEQLPQKPEGWFSVISFEPSEPKPSPLIVDLSGLWAGPLASRLLAMIGARVIKIESPNRPDGMRLGHAGFYALLNGQKDCAAFDFHDPQDLMNLKTLLHAADVVITASRPRAFPQLGIDAEAYMAARPGKIWARLTAYGQDNNRIGFGDDIGVSAGLSSIMEQAHGEACFAGDAIADPVNGVHLALVIKAFLSRGGGALIDLNMRDVLRFAMGDIPQDIQQTTRDWQQLASNDAAPLYPMRTANVMPKTLGADTDKILAELC